MHAATVGVGFVVGDAGTARHLEAAVFANTHAAAIGGIVAGDAAAGHLEGAAAANYIHAAAVFGGIIAGDGGDVLAVGGRGHGEFSAVHTHAAASVGGVGIILIRAADAAAGHLEGAAAADYIHAAAVFGGIIAGDGGDVLAVGGRGHGEATFAGHIHAAASVGFVAGDAAAGHLEVGLRIYAAAARTGKMSMVARMFTVRMTDDLGILDLMCCIPVDESFDGAERMEFAETPGLCIYYRGPYEGTGEAMKALMKHISENSIEAAGRLRSVYLEGPPNRGDNSADYITQIAVPIKKFEKV